MASSISTIAPILIRTPDDLVANAYLGAPEFRSRGEYGRRPASYLAPVGSSPNNILLHVFVANGSQSETVHRELLQVLIEGGDFGHWFLIKVANNAEIEQRVMTTAVPSQYNCPFVRVSPALMDPQTITSTMSMPHAAGVGGAGSAGAGGNGSGSSSSPRSGGIFRGVPASAPNALMFVAVIMSQSMLHAVCCKVLWASSRDQMAEMIFSEAINGYGVGFTGAMLSDEYEYLRQAREYIEKGEGVEVELKTVNSYKALMERRGEGGAAMVKEMRKDMGRGEGEKVVTVVEFGLWC